MDRVVVVGSSLAGFRVAETLRAQGFDGTLTLVGDEPHRPYDRPPLSKQVLTGEWDVERTFLPSAAPAETAGAEPYDWRLGQRAVALDLGARSVALADGERVGFDGLVIATGCRPRTIGDAPLDGVHVLRTLDDAVALRDELDAGPDRVVVIGAGFIGSEVAASCRARDLAVTLVEALPVPLERVLGADMGALTADLHRDHGVDLRLGVGVDGFDHDGSGHVAGVRLSDGTTVAARVVVVGIGVIPNTEWLDGAGLTIDNGVVCDATCLAAPGVVAAGDVARWPNARFGGELMRVEHWDNALEMGGAAGMRLLAGGDGGVPYEPVPWFWSDLYDRKIQLAGRAGPDDEVQVVHGDVAERRFVALYGRRGRVVGALGWNRPRHVMQWRQRLQVGMDWADALELARERAVTALAWALLAVTAVFAVGDWISRATENRRLEFVCKPATTIGLLAVALALEPADSATRAWFVVALVFSLGGDVFLMIGGDAEPEAEAGEDDDKWFILGLSSFLIGHVAYIVGLITAGIEGGALVVGIVVVLVAMAVVGRRVINAVRAGDEPELTVPVAAYMTVISVMVACAIGTTSALAIAGAGLFYVSDALIGWNKFVKLYAWGSVAIMVTYHLAQAGLVLSLT